VLIALLLLELEIDFTHLQPSFSKSSLLDLYKVIVQIIGRTKFRHCMFIQMKGILVLCYYNSINLDHNITIFLFIFGANLCFPRKRGLVIQSSIVR